MYRLNWDSQCTRIHGWKRSHDGLVNFIDQGLHILLQKKKSNESSQENKTILLSDLIWLLMGKKQLQATYKGFKCWLVGSHFIYATSWTESWCPYRYSRNHNWYKMGIPRINNRWFTKRPYVWLWTIRYVSKKLRAHVTWSTHNLCIRNITTLSNSPSYSLTPTPPTRNRYKWLLKKHVINVSTDS